MEDEIFICRHNGKCMNEAMMHIQNAITELKQIDP